MDQVQMFTTKKSVKKDGSRLGFAMLWYAIISLGITMIAGLVELFVRLADEVQGITDTAEQERLLDEIVTSVFEESGTAMIIGVVVAMLFLVLYYRKSDVPKAIFRSEKKMTIARFAGLACAFFGFQLVCQGAYAVMEAGLNLIGYTAESSMDSATMTSQTVSMFIYAGIVAPVVEELVYRGFAMRAAEKHGKMFAIVVSSVLFGVMHANLPQGVFAFFVGLVLAYVAIEYSIVWSIALHILNNLVLGDLLGKALEPFSVQMQTIVSYGILGVFFVIGLIVIIRNRREIVAFVRQNMWEKPKMRLTLTSLGMILFIAVHVFMAVDMLEKL